jgi:hypothetical protein
MKRRSFQVAPAIATVVAQDSEARMTKLLEQGIEAVRALPDDRQDMAGRILLEIAGDRSPEYSLTPEQIEDVKAALDEMERGEFATDEEIEEVWRRFEK